MQLPGGLRDVRLSVKLSEARPETLGHGLRTDIEATLGGEEAVASLEGAIRAGCVHLIAQAMVQVPRRTHVA